MKRNIMECQFCGQALPDNAKFCFKCKKQIVCQKCGERLVDEADICIYCGASILTSVKSNAQNYIRYKESQTEKSFEATFSNETAGAVVETFASFLPLNKYPKAISITTDNADEASFVNVENEEQPQLAAPILGEVRSDDDSNPINTIFKRRGENEIYLHETSLKANSKSDYTGRLTILYLYYNQINGINEVKRSEVNDFIVKTGLSNDGNYRAWISKAKSLFSINNGMYCLCRAGEERAKEYLDDIFNKEKTDKWKLGNITKSSQKSTTSKSPKKGVSYSIVSGLNLKPSNKDSLKKFVALYNITNGAEYNLVFVYYLQKIIEEKNISPNHIYTCYMDLSVKFPSNIRQSLIDTKNKKGWIDTSSMTNICLTTVGENAILELKK